MIVVAKAGFRAIAPDFRGYGLCDTPSEPSKVEFSDLVSDLLGILDALSIPKVMVLMESLLEQLLLLLLCWLLCLLLHLLFGDEEIHKIISLMYLLKKILKLTWGSSKNILYASCKLPLIILAN